MYLSLQLLLYISTMLCICLSPVDGTYWKSAFHYQQRPRPNAASIVQANREIFVPQGCSVPVDPLNHLIIRVLPGDRCQLSVLDHELLTQRFGMLTPKKFPCSFQKGEVKYTHFGSLSTQMDRVRLHLRYDTQTDTIILPITLQIVVTSNAMTAVILNQPLLVDKRTSYSNPITSQRLGIAIVREGSKCLLTPLLGTGGFPKYGTLLNYIQNSHGVDCNAFLNLGVHYKMNSVTGSPRVDFIPMVVEQFDQQGRKLQQEHFQVKVVIDPSVKNTPPRPSFMSLMMMEVSQFVMTAITSDMLEAEDLDSDSDELIFSVVSPPERGHIISTDDHNRPVSSFYQRDLKDLRIAYKPPSEDSDKERILHVEFVVVDAEGSMSDHFSFMILVKPMNTLAPVVTINNGQVLFKGQSRPILNTHNLRISDEDNLADVRVSVVRGLQHGTLTVLGSQRKFFTTDDLAAGVVVYEHDGSKTSCDNIVFRMTDGKNEVEFLFPVTIVLLADEPPIVNINTGLVIMKGEMRPILPTALSATDVDSEDRKLKFIVVPPYSSLGQLVLKQNDTPSEPSGWRFNEMNNIFERVVVEWYLHDILEARLFYHYVGTHLTTVVTDQFTFRVQDDDEPPNQSEVHTFHVKIYPVDNLAPELHSGTTLQITVNEHELTVLNKNALQYTDLNCNANDLRYTIINPPSEVGHIVLTDNPNTILKEFTQAQINHGKVSYQPPNQEIGLTERKIQFTFTVRDKTGNFANGHFTILLQPINNSPPQITNTEFNVECNSSFIITKDILDVKDVDTASENITFTVTQVPSNGILRCLNLNLTVGKTFRIRDIERGVLVYVHYGDKKSLFDTFKVDVSDGIHHAPITVKININAKTPVIPVNTLHSGIMDFTVEVEENGIAKIMTNRIKNNTENMRVTLTIESFPRFGVIRVNGVPASIFTLQDFLDGVVTYIHTAGEVGLVRKIDSFILRVSDKWIVNGTIIQQIRVQVPILPVDSIPPVIQVEEQFSVEEGGKKVITVQNIQVMDEDTHISNIVCTVLVQPTFGYIENVSPAPGYEKSRAGFAITAFSIKDVHQGHIYYVQSVHKGTEPVEDRFTFQCTDGTNISDQHIFPIVIVPVNDEEPVVFCREFVVVEGMSLTVDIPILNGVDADIPKDNLEFKIITNPKHGKLVRHLANGSQLIITFTLQEILSSPGIVYEHDGSETRNDSFTLRQSDGKHLVEKQIVVLILPVDDETPRLNVNNGLEVKIGEVKTITNHELKATDLDSLDSNLTFIIRQAPLHGFLQKLGRSKYSVFNLTIGMNFTQDDIDKLLIQYVHTGQGGVRDLLKFDVTDGFNPLVDRYFYITVGAIDTVFPVVVNKGVTLPEGGTVTLTTDILSSSDLNSPDQLLVFTVTRGPHRGRLECSDHPGISISFFTQLQLAGSKIRYIHTSKEEARMDSFEFQVSDGQNLVFRTFRVSVTDVDNKRPILNVHMLVLGKGKIKCITPFEISVEDQDTPNQLLQFSIIRGPIHGKILYNNTRIITIFTKKDLSENLITYEHDGTTNGEDDIIFTLTDGTHSGFYVFPNMEHETSKPQTLKIRILLESHETLRIVVNRPALSLSVLHTGEHGFKFSSKVLRAEALKQGKKVQKDDLIFRVVKPPRYGYIRHTELNNTSMFTQADINDMKLYYILPDGINSTGDVFSFTVENKRGNRLDSQLFRLQWSWVSLERQFYRVEEESLVLEVQLRRRGFLGETSFVSISVADGTAVRGQDFHGNVQRQVQFNPGQTHATWRLRILDDQVYESSESFRIILADPILTLLERPNTATVEIIDTEDESTVFFPHNEIRVEENVGELLIPVQRRGDVTQELMVTCYTQQGSARGTVPGSVLSFSDFISRPEDRSSVLLFERGEREKMCRVFIIDDSLYEGPESFDVTLATPMGGRLGAENSSVHVIIQPHDDDVPVVFFRSSVYSVAEDAGFVEVQVGRSGSDLSHSATVTLTTAATEPVSAQAGVDYVAVGRSVSFAPGVTIVTVKVQILDDVGGPVLEGVEQFVLVLNMPMNATLGQPIRATVTIDDSQCDVPVLEFALSEYRVSEADGRVFAVVVKSGDLTQRSEVRCYTRQSSAQAMMDYDERPDSDLSIITFQPGDRQRTCEVSIVDDTEYEEEEEFRLVLGIPSGKPLAGINFGKQRETLVKITDQRDKPVIQFSETRFSVQEPRNPGETVPVRIKVQRLGDCSRTSVVRVHTRDGSASSGEDYTPVSVELVFAERQTEHIVEILVLHDTEREVRETFTVLLKPDENMVADVKRTKAMVFIEEGGASGGVTFPAVPEIVSLLVYEEETTHRSTGLRPLAGYPLICVTACDRRHSQFSVLQSVCVSERLNDSLSEFRWFVGPAGAAGPLKELEMGAFMAPVSSRLLDGVYFRAGWRVRCSVRAVSLTGHGGKELSSGIIEISTEDGMCPSHTPGVMGAEPFSAKIRYTGADDALHPHSISITVTLPHVDGLLPLISTRPLSDWLVILSVDGSRVGNHRCSNLLDAHESSTRFAFLTGGSSRSSSLWSPIARRFYSNLDLEACLWTFRSYYDMSELLSDCGGVVTTDGQVLSTVQSFVSLRLPLYVSYLFRAPSGWMNFDLQTDLRLSFVYDTSILWQQGISSPTDTELRGALYPTSMRINSEGRLVVTFKTEAHFHGRFIVSHSGSSVQSEVRCVDRSGLSFSLSLISSDSTFNQPTQTWRFTSQHSVQDYSGSYSVSLVPCVAPPTLDYSSSPVCHPQQPIKFNLDVRFQQVSDAVAEKFTLNTNLYLMSKKELWLSDGSMGLGEGSDVVFSEGSQIFGRVMVDPVQNLGSSFVCRVLKVFLCVGADGYVPKYQPDQREYGCLADAPTLLYRLKILDKSSPEMQDLLFGDVPFDAYFAEDMVGAEPLVKQAGSDGFSLSSAPLFQVAAGRQWYVHVVYTVHSNNKHIQRRTQRSLDRDLQLHSLSSSTLRSQNTEHRPITLRRRAAEHIGEESGRGTNLQPVTLLRPPSAFRDPRNEAPDLGEELQTDMVSLEDWGETGIKVTPAVMLCLVVVVCATGITVFIFCSRQRRREHTDGNTHTIETPQTHSLAAHTHCPGLHAPYRLQGPNRDMDHSGNTEV